MSIHEKDVLAGRCLNGRIVVKIDQDQVKEDLGLSKDSPLYIPHERAFAGAASRGKVVKMAPDAFGQAYKEKYGDEVVPPKEGQYILFTPYQSAQIDKEGLYYLVIDDGVHFVFQS